MRTVRETSIEGFEASRIQRGLLKETILNYSKKMGPYGFTDFEFADYSGAGRSSICGTRAVLMAEGVIVDSGDRRVSPANVKSIVWCHVSFAGFGGDECTL